VQIRWKPGSTDKQSKRSDEAAAAAGHQWASTRKGKGEGEAVVWRRRWRAQLREEEEEEG
jgi:hypothetical protein